MRIVRVIAAAAVLAGCPAPTRTSGPSSGGGGGGGGVTGPRNVSCELRIGLRCGDGQVDGCVAGKTTLHVCMPANEEPGPPCSQEIAKQCPAGQTDACLKSPPAAANHLCVY